jgi:hypothetical protein
MAGYFNKRMASALNVYVKCPSTGRTLDADRHDDKVLCNCPLAMSRGGTHIVSQCERSSVEQWMVEHDYTDMAERKDGE